VEEVPPNHPFNNITDFHQRIRDIFHGVIRIKKKYKSNLLRTTRFLNNLHQVSSFSIIGKLPLDVEKSII
jgi:hypothetical protein